MHQPQEVLSALFEQVGPLYHVLDREVAEERAKRLVDHEEGVDDPLRDRAELGRLGKGGQQVHAFLEQDQRHLRAGLRVAGVNTREYRRRPNRKCMFGKSWASLVRIWALR